MRPASLFSQGVKAVRSLPNHQMRLHGCLPIRTQKKKWRWRTCHWCLILLRASLLILPRLRKNDKNQIKIHIKHRPQKWMTWWQKVFHQRPKIWVWKVKCSGKLKRLWNVQNTTGTSNQGLIAGTEKAARVAADLALSKPWNKSCRAETVRQPVQKNTTIKRLWRLAKARSPLANCSSTRWCLKQYSTHLQTEANIFHRIHPNKDWTST